MAPHYLPQSRNKSKRNKTASITPWKKHPSYKSHLIKTKKARIYNSANPWENIFTGAWRASRYEQFKLGSSFASKWSMRVTRNCKRPHKDISLPARTKRSHEEEGAWKTSTLLTSHSGRRFVSPRLRQMDEKKRKKRKERRKKAEEGKSDAASGPSWRKGEFSAISLSAMAAQRGARHQRRVKVIAGGCTSPILAPVRG